MCGGEDVGVVSDGDEDGAFCLERRGREGEDELVCGFSFFSLLIVDGILAPPFPSP